MKKQTRKKPPRRKPIKIIVAFGYVTKERIEALPEPVKARLGRVLYAFALRRAAEEQGAVKMAA